VVLFFVSSSASLEKRRRGKHLFCALWFWDVCVVVLWFIYEVLLLYN